jgi:hypothetical protein
MIRGRKLVKKKRKKTKWGYAYFDKDTPFWAPVVGGGRTRMIITRGTLCKLEEIKRKGGKDA